ncbi:MAG: efflux RND transporter periplasmic adaptor subunit, partial [Georgfuchsia sp.]
RFMPGEALYEVADLSSVWVLADVFEQDIGLVRTGAKAKVMISAYPDKVFEGAITYVYPTLNAQTRTVPVRVELANPGLLLKPGMFAQVELPVLAKGKVVTVPVSAVIDSGTRQMILIQLGEGRFEPREVKLGARSDSYVEVVDGVKDGEPVVVAANFLIDAESNLKAAVGSFGPAKESGASTPPGGTATVDHHAEGKLDTIDAKAGTVTITHGPIESLKWPGMTMDFALANAALLGDFKPGARVAFTFVERSPGEWVIIKLEAADAPAHSGH